MITKSIALASPDTYVEMYGALQGIAGSSAIVHIDALELLEDEEIDNK